MAQAKRGTARKAPVRKKATTKAARSVSKPMSAVDHADPRFEPVARALARTSGFSLMESKSRALRGLMLNGKSFGMSSHGRLILKLDEARVAALIADGVGKPFSPGPGRVMKGWLEVTQPKADWLKLAKQALALAASAGKQPKR